MKSSNNKVFALKVPQEVKDGYDSRTPSEKKMICDIVRDTLKVILENEYVDVEKHLENLLDSKLKQGMNELKNQEKIRHNSMMEFLEKSLTIPKVNEEYVYIITTAHYESEGIYKIGKSIDVKSRMNSLQTGVPEKIKTILTIPTNDATRTEKELHDKYSCNQIRGEWFQLSSTDIQSIISNYCNTPLDSLDGWIAQERGVLL